jgi:hypothetical protein
MFRNRVLPTTVPVDRSTVANGTSEPSTAAARALST